MAESKYKCKKCGKSFRTVTSYINHDLKVHAALDAPGGTLECPLCGSIFTSSSGLKCHDTLKHAAKLHVCTKCKKTFATKRHLEDHKIVHNSDHSCNKCGESYNNLLDLCIHGTITHENNNEVSCFMCKEVLESHAHLKLHVINLHEEEIPRILDRANFYYARSSARNVSHDNVPDSWDSLGIFEDDIQALKDGISARETSMPVQTPQEASAHNSDDPEFSQSQSPEIEIQRSSDDSFDSAAALDIPDENISILHEASAGETGMHVEPQKAHARNFDYPKLEQSQIHHDETARNLDKPQSSSSIHLEENIFSGDMSDLLAPIDISNEDAPVLHEPSARETSIHAGLKASSHEHCFLEP